MSVYLFFFLWFYLFFLIWTGGTTLKSFFDSEFMQMFLNDLRLARIVSVVFSFFLVLKRNIELVFQINSILAFLVSRYGFFVSLANLFLYIYPKKEKKTREKRIIINRKITAPTPATVAVKCRKSWIKVSIDFAGANSVKRNFFLSFFLFCSLFFVADFCLFVYLFDEQTHNHHCFFVSFFWSDNLNYTQIHSIQRKFKRWVNSDHDELISFALTLTLILIHSFEIYFHCVYIFTRWFCFAFYFFIILFSFHSRSFFFCLA